MELEPLKQFAIKPIVQMSLFGVDVSFSNSSLFMVLSMLSLVVFGLLYVKKYDEVNGITRINRLQAAAELLYEMVNQTILGTCGDKGLKYRAEIFSLFIFIMLCNAFGMIPGGFTATSHIVVTFALALVLFIFINVIGFAKHGLHYFSLFLPKGTPGFLAPLMIVIELFTYLSRPFSLALRLAANMTAGHIVLKVFAVFVTASGIIGIFPFGMLIILTAFEIFVALLQAYIFTILTCAYLNDAINMHS